MKHKIDTTNWLDFSYNDLFSIIAVQKVIKAKDFDEDGKVPVYSSSNLNNGISGFTNLEPTFRISDEIPFYIVFGDHTRALHIVATDFITQDNVKVLIPKVLNFYAILFVITVWHNSIPYIGYARHWSVASETKIRLPITNEDEPNWKYMEEYMRNIMNKSKSTLTSYGVASGKKSPIDIKGWKRFHLYDHCLFDIDMGTKLDKVKMTQINPDVNFVGRANANNGITIRVDRLPDITPYEPGNMTLSLGGEYLGSCFVQPDYFYTSQNVVVLIPKWDMPLEVKQFIATMIFRESRLYYKAFIDELNRHIKRDFTFYLPVTDSGEPDWEYMVISMRNAELEAKAELNALVTTI